MTDSKEKNGSKQVVVNVSMAESRLIVGKERLGKWLNPDKAMAKKTIDKFINAKLPFFCLDGTYYFHKDRVNDYFSRLCGKQERVDTNERD